MRQRSVIATIIVGVVLVLKPRPAEAHVALQTMGGFWSGVADLLTSFDQIGLLFGLAIWASFQPRGLDARLIAAVFLTRLAGALLAPAYPGLDIEATGIVAGLMIATGLVGAAMVRLGPLPLLGLAGAGELVGGAAAGGAPPGMSLSLFALGNSIAGASVLSYTLLATRRFEAGWVRLGLRVGASWIAAIGLMVFALFCAQHFGRAWSRAG